MSWAQVQTAVEQRLSAAWTATPIRYENRPFQPPAGPYLAVSVREGESHKASLGPAPQLRRRRGVVIVQVFDRENAGLLTIKTYAEQVAALFRDVQLSLSATAVLHCFEPSLSTAPTLHGWAQVNVTIPFEVDEVL